MGHLSASAADPAGLSLPLRGYYHPGRYVPVRAHASTTGTPVSMAGVANADTGMRVSAPGAIALWIRYRNPFDATFPFLQVDQRATRINWSLDSGTGSSLDTPLRPLAEHQRLIGFTVADEMLARQLAAKLFPNDELIPVALEKTDPIPGSPAAWESLDALILDTPSIAGLDEHRLGVLVACGVAVVLRADRPPLPHWPWEPITSEGGDHYWVLRHNPSGPRAATYNDAVYRPVLSWRPGWPPAFRRQLVLMGVAFSVLALVVGLLRPPWTPLWMLGLVGLTVGGLSYYWSFQTPLVQRSGEVVVLEKKMAQIDDWLYQTSFRPMQSFVVWGDYTKPIYPSPARLDDANATLFCHPNGDPEQFYHVVDDGFRIAMVMRRVGPRGPEAAPAQPITSPMLDTIKEAYLHPGDRLAGELPATPLLGTPYAGLELWPAVVIDRR